MTMGRVGFDTHDNDKYYSTCIKSRIFMVLAQASIFMALRI